MKILCDFHHGALARAMFYLFGDRLNFEFYFPSVEATCEAGAAADGTWGCPSDVSWDMVGISPDLQPKILRATFEEIKSDMWDIVVLTRKESQKVFKSLGHPKPGVVYLGVSGNEGTFYEPWVTHFIGTDLHSYESYHPRAHKIMIPQELGRHFDQGFQPIKPEALHTVRQYANNLSGYDIPIKVRNWPTPVNIKKLWDGMIAALPGYNLVPHGHGNEGIGGSSIPDGELAPYYYDSALTWHFKTYEGYGHALLQSLPAGRPVIVPKGFYSDRAARKYLIEGAGSYACAYDVDEIVETIKRLTSSLEVANENALKAYTTYKRKFDFAADAERVKEWLQKTM